MIRPQTLRLHRIPTLLNLINPKSHSETHLIPSIHTKSSTPNSIFSRNISLSSQFRHEFPPQQTNQKSKKPLETLIDIKDDEVEKEKEKISKNLRNLEVELRRYKKDSIFKTKPLSDLSKPLETLFTEAVGLSGNTQESKMGLKELSNLFSSSDQRGKSRKGCKKVEEFMEFKELSVEMANFAKYLHTKGYLNNANFLPNNEFDASCFVNNYGRDFLKYAAEKFAKDHPEIYKWLPNSELKKVAQFGCPSLGRKNVFSAKAMRFCYGIREETVCNKCVLKASCKFVNQSVWKRGAKNMDLTVVMRVITLYALETVPTQLQVPDDVKEAVNRLLKEVIRLSEIEYKGSFSQLIE